MWRSRNSSHKDKKGAGLETPPSDIPPSTRARGDDGERIAGKYLKRHGFTILDTKYRAHGGEIDIVAREGQVVVFIEVKAASNPAFDDPLTWIPQWKQDRIVKTALSYGKAHNLLDTAMRFDVVTVDARQEVHHVRDAFRPSTRFFV